MRIPRRTAAFAAVLVSLQTARADGSADDPASLRAEMERRLSEMEERHRREMDDLRRSIAAPARRTVLEEQIDELAEHGHDGHRHAPAAAGAEHGLHGLDVSLSSLFTAGTSTGTEDQVRALQAGGHDPKRRGFTVQNVELLLSGAIDTWLEAEASVVTLLSPEGETEVELEEAFARTTSLPAGLRITAGHFLTAFGRHNVQHPHAWDFVDVPVVNARILGADGMRGPGAQLSWRGTDVPLELTGAIQNANGETMASFLSEEPPAGSPVARRVRSFHDTTMSARAALSLDAADCVPVVLGVSGAFGPSGATSGDDARVLGVDVTATWRPGGADAEAPCVALRAEAMARRFEFDDRFGGLDELHDGGWYAQALWGFRRGWTLGLRHDSVRGIDDAVPGLDDRTRWSAALTHEIGASASLRLQVNRDASDALRRDVTSVWLQLEFELGRHADHEF